MTVGPGESRRLPVGRALALALVLVGCGDEATPTDAGALDGAFGDAGLDAAVDAGPLVVCGDGLLGPGESCDDGATTPGDGCSSTCRFEARCGDGEVGAPEVCDDSGVVSGDGCRADCASDETCGNGWVDWAAGEVCDGDPACSDDCLSRPGCGDGVIDADAAETCDDGGLERYDGCGPDCREEVMLVVDEAAFAGEREGCDFSGDGQPDNAIARGLSLGRALLDEGLRRGIETGDSITLLPFYGLDDEIDDDDLRVGVLLGNDDDFDATNNLGGEGRFFVWEGSVRDGRDMRKSLHATLSGGALSAGPEDFRLIMDFFFTFTLRAQMGRARLTGSLVRDEEGRLRLRDGLLCGAVTVGSLAEIEVNPLTFLLDYLVLPGCDDAGAPSRFIDSVAGGARAAGIRTRATQPDVDLDGDGLEQLLLDREGLDACNPVVVACVDGDGTLIDGPDCVSDPRIADGFSAALTLSAIEGRFTGVR